MAGNENDDRGRSGLVRVVNGNGENGGNGSDPLAFATQPANPGPGNDSGNPGNGGNGSEVEDLRAELAQLRGEVERLRLAGGLEARRDEPATVGDVLDANAAAVAGLREELRCLIDAEGQAVCERIAVGVSDQLLNGINGEENDEGEDDEEENGKAAAKGKPKGKKAQTPELAIDYSEGYVLKGRRGLWFQGSDGEWYDEDGNRAD